jgi:hypothetical protein
VTGVALVLFWPAAFMVEEGSSFDNSAGPSPGPRIMPISLLLS